MKNTKSIVAAITLATVVTSTVSTTALAANTISAISTRDKGQTVYVDTSRIYPTGYNIAINNYFKLRDIGKIVDFGVSFDAATSSVHIVSDGSYVPESGESSVITDTAKSGALAALTNQTIYVDGQKVTPTVYQISGNNYFKLRDFGKLVDFGVTFDAAASRVVISPDSKYVEETTPPTTPSLPSGAMTEWTGIVFDWQTEMERDWNASAHIEICKRYADRIVGKSGATLSELATVISNLKNSPWVNYAMDESVRAFRS